MILMNKVTSQCDINHDSNLRECCAVFNILTHSLRSKLRYVSRMPCFGILKTPSSSTKDESLVPRFSFVRLFLNSQTLSDKFFV
ncbi:hypothetical protein C8R42DRAFT_675042 [Lentinula raphanica]|nr:hypothetical protein C8R42DRAFT_675042 [Lentinula raphanica]